MAGLGEDRRRCGWVDCGGTSETMIVSVPLGKKSDGKGDNGLQRRLTEGKLCAADLRAVWVVYDDMGVATLGSRAWVLSVFDGSRWLT